MAQHTPLGRGPVRLNHFDRQVSADHLHFEAIGKQQADLLAWYEKAHAEGRMEEIWPDYHRLQLEKWIHDRATSLMTPSGATADGGEQSLAEAKEAWSRRKAIDFGVIQRRKWQDDRYVTAGVNGEAEQVKIDLCQSIPVDSEHAEAYDVVICSEVLEHVTHPRDAVDTLFYLCKPGGTLLITSPFLWPDHSTEGYADYWRFTEGAWRMLMKHAEFEIVKIQAASWTYDGGFLYNLLRRFEAWGFFSQVEGTTGYMVEAKRPIGVNRKPGGQPLPNPAT